jgi:hypothetical protein
MNEMEYATGIVNFAASMHYWLTQKKREELNIPYPTVLIMGNNKTTESYGRPRGTNNPLQAAPWAESNAPS